MPHIGDDIEDAEHHLVARLQAPDLRKEFRQPHERVDDGSGRHQEEGDEERGLEEEIACQRADDEQEQGHDNCEAHHTRRRHLQMRDIHAPLEPISCRLVRPEPDDAFAYAACPLVPSQGLGPDLFLELAVVPARDVLERALPGESQLLHDPLQVPLRHFLFFHAILFCAISACSTAKYSLLAAVFRSLSPRLFFTAPAKSTALSTHLNISLPIAISASLTPLIFLLTLYLSTNSLFASSFVFTSSLLSMQ